MNTKKLLHLGAFVAAVTATMGANCPSIPSIQERIVELVMGGSITEEFHALGEINDKGEVGQEDLANPLGEALDLTEILDGAGIDVSDTDGIALAGVEIRVTIPDDTPGREITNTTVMVGRDGAGLVPLVTGFSQSATAVTGWIPVSLEAGGVGVINGILEDFLDAAKAGEDLDSVILNYSWEGLSVPTDVVTDFHWEIRLSINITGTVEVDVLG